MKALPLIWRFPEVYKNHVISPGAFHTVMNYLGVVTNRKCRGSGYAEILVESSLVTTGKLEAVLKGKAYATALFCLKSVVEAMERLLLETFLEEESSNIQSLTNVSKFATHICRESLSLLLQEAAYNELLEKLINYEEVRKGKLGATAQFWMQFIDNAQLVLMTLYSVKTNNLDLFH